MGIKSSKLYENSDEADGNFNSYKSDIEELVAYSNMTLPVDFNELLTFTLNNNKSDINFFSNGFKVGKTYLNIFCIYLKISNNFIPQISNIFLKLNCKIKYFYYYPETSNLSNFSKLTKSLNKTIVECFYFMGNENKTKNINFSIENIFKNLKNNFYKYEIRTQTSSLGYTDTEYLF